MKKLLSLILFFFLIFPCLTFVDTHTAAFCGAQLDSQVIVDGVSTYYIRVQNNDGVGRAYAHVGGNGAFYDSEAYNCGGNLTAHTAFVAGQNMSFYCNNTAP